MKPIVFKLIVALACAFTVIKVSAQDYTVENIVYHCLKEAYKNQGVDLMQEVKALETYLIETQDMIDSSGNSYLQLYRNIAATKNVSIFIAPSLTKRLHQAKPTSGESNLCLDSLQHISPVVKNNSKYYQLRNEYQRQILNDNLNIGSIASTILEVLNTEDFKHPYYRAWCMLTLSYAANSSAGLTIKNDSVVVKAKVVCTNPQKIECLAGDDFLYNGKKVEIEKLKKELEEYIKETKANNCIVLSNSNGTYYGAYSTMYDLILSVYKKVQNELALTRFNKTIEQCNAFELDEITKVYPQRITEQ